MTTPTTYYDNDKRKECFLGVYEAVKETIGKYYENQIITLNDLCIMLTPVVSSVISDHVEAMTMLSPEQKSEAFQEALTLCIKMLENSKKTRKEENLK